MTDTLDREDEARAAGLTPTVSTLHPICARLAAGLGYPDFEVFRVQNPGRLWRMGNPNDIEVGTALLGGLVFFVDRDEDLIAIGFGRAES